MASAQEEALIMTAPEFAPSKQGGLSHSNGQWVARQERADVCVCVMCLSPPPPTNSFTLYVNLFSLIKYLELLN